MSAQAFQAKVYAKEGCPFSFKVLVFLAEARLLDEVEIVRLDPRDAGFEPTRAMLEQKLGRAATFPTAEVEPGRFMADSDALVEYFAAQHGVAWERMPVLAFYQQTIFPQLVELHES